MRVSRAYFRARVGGTFDALPRPKSCRRPNFWTRQTQLFDPLADTTGKKPPPSPWRPRPIFRFYSRRS